MNDEAATDEIDPGDASLAAPTERVPPASERRRWFSPQFRRFVVRRVIALILIILGVTVITFSLTQYVPGDPAFAALGPDGIQDEAAVEAFRARHGLDQPGPVQYFVYLGNLVRGDFGESQVTRRPVIDDLIRRAPATLELTFAALVMGVVLGIGLGTLAAMFRNSALDHVIRVLSLGGVSMPLFWLAFIAFYVFFFVLGIAPGAGRLPPGMSPPPMITGFYTIDALFAGEWATFRATAARLVLPSAVLASFEAGLIIRVTRTAVLDVLEKDFVRMARSKGLREFRVIFRYVLSAALTPIVTVLGNGFGAMVSGAVLIEIIFSWPGIGEYAFRSSSNLDLTAIMGVTIFIAVTYVFLNFVIDIVYGLIDPRLRVG